MFSCIGTGSHIERIFIYIYIYQLCLCMGLPGAVTAIEPFFG